MTRRSLMLLAAATACAPRHARELLPANLEAWSRQDLRDVPPSSAPDPMPRDSVQRIQAATYAGPGTLEATVYELGSSATALDMAQRWPPAAETVFFYKDQYFVVLKWQQAERNAVTALVRALERHLGS
jgi:hypothetical protein